MTIAELRFEYTNRIRPFRYWRGVRKHGVPQHILKMVRGGNLERHGPSRYDIDRPVDPVAQRLWYEMLRWAGWIEGRLSEYVLSVDPKHDRERRMRSAAQRWLQLLGPDTPRYPRDLVHYAFELVADFDEARTGDRPSDRALWGEFRRSWRGKSDYNKCGRDRIAEYVCCLLCAI